MTTRTKAKIALRTTIQQALLLPSYQPHSPKHRKQNMANLSQNNTSMSSNKHNTQQRRPKPKHNCSLAGLQNNAKDPSKIELSWPLKCHWKTSLFLL